MLTLKVHACMNIAMSEKDQGNIAPVSACCQTSQLSVAMSTIQCY